MKDLSTVGIFPSEPVQNPNKVADPQWDAASLVGNFAAGYFEGFTTFDAAGYFHLLDSPDTTQEHIARSLGSVLGFVGFLPLPANFARLGYRTMAKAFELTGNLAGAERMYKGLTTIGKDYQQIASVPGVFGKYLSTVVMKATETTAAKAVLEFGEQWTGLTASATVKGVAKSAAESALFMGFASAASARPLNPIDLFTSRELHDRFKVFKQSLPMGAGFGLLGSVFSKQLMEKLGVDSFASLPKEKQDLLLKTMRAVSSGLAMGGYSKAAGYPNELVMYESLVNGIFGWNELPWHDKEALHLISKYKMNDYTKADWWFNPSEYLKKQGVEAHKLVFDSVDLALTTQYGTPPATEDFFKEAMARSIAAVDNIDPSEIQDPMGEYAKRVGGADATASQAVFHFEELVKASEEGMIKSHTERTGEAPSEEDVADIKKQALGAAEGQLYRELLTGQYNSAELVELHARMGEFQASKSQRPLDQVLQYNQTMREMQGAPVRLIDITIPMQDALGERTVFDAAATIGKTFMDAKNEKVEDYGVVKKRIEGTLGVSIPADKERDLHIMWQQYKSARQSDIRVYDPATGKLIKETSHKKDGTPSYEMRGEAPIEEILGQRLIEVKEGVEHYKQGKGKQEKELSRRKSINDASLFNLAKMQFEQFKEGLFYMFGRKDDNKHYFIETPLGFNVEPDGTYSWSIKGVKHTFDRNKEFAMLASPEEARKEYERDRERFVSDIVGDKKLKEGVPDAISNQARKAYDDMYALNAMIMKHFNSIQNIGEIFADKNSFSIQNAVAFNKRTQVLVDGNPKVDKGLIGKDSFSARIIQWKPESLGLFRDLYNKYMETQEDGVLWVRPEIAEKMLIPGGFGKASIVAPGGFIGKLGIHVMTPKEVEHLTAAGLKEDMLFMESATKQAGRRARTTISLEKGENGEYKIVHDDVAPEMYDLENGFQNKSFEIPVDAVRMNYGVSEDEMMKDVHLVKQLINHSDEDPELARYITNNIILPSYHGDRDALQAEGPLEARTASEAGIEKKPLVTNTERFKSLAGQPLGEQTMEISVPIEYKIMHRIPMVFTDGTNGNAMREEFRGKSTMDLSLSGDRTATSRSPKAAKGIMKGDIIEIYDNNRKLIVRATTDEYPLSNITREEWSKLEGWSPEVYDKIKDKGYVQFKYEKVPTSTTKTIKKESAPINMDKVDADELWEVIRKRPNDGRLKLTMDYLMKHVFEKGDEMDDDEVKAIANLHRTQTIVSALTNAAGEYAYNPTFMSQPPIRKYMEQAMYRLSTERLQRPAHQGSFKSKMGYLSPIELMELEKKGIVFDNTTVMFGDKQREKQYLFNGKMEKLGDLWDEYQKKVKMKSFWRSIMIQEGKNPDRIVNDIDMERPGFKEVVMLDPTLTDAQKESFIKTGWYEGLNSSTGVPDENQKRNEALAQFFNNVVSVRVPLSDLSGARNLRFAGFIEGGGWKSFVHPENMQNMDGADLDGDSAFHYFGMPKIWTDVLSRPEVRNRFMSEGRFLPVKGVDENLNGKEDLTFLKKERLGMFSPYQRAIANRAANIGKSALGPGLTAAFRGKQLAKYLNATGPMEIDLKVDGKDVSYTLIPREDKMRQKATQTDTVNRAADAADGNSMADNDRVRAANILSVMKVFRNGKELSDAEAIDLLSHRNASKDPSRMGSLVLNQLPIIRTLYNIDNALRMVDFDGTTREIGEIASKVNEATAHLDQGEVDGVRIADLLNNPWYAGAMELSKSLHEHPYIKGSFLHPVSYKLLTDIADNFVKTNTPLSRLLLRILGRTGVSFRTSNLFDKNKSKSAFAMWDEELVPYFRGKKVTTEINGKKVEVDAEQYYKDDFIKSADARESKLYNEILPKFPRNGIPGDYRRDFLEKLAEASLQFSNVLVREDRNAYTVNFIDKDGNEQQRTYRSGTAAENKAKADAYAHVLMNKLGARQVFEHTHPDREWYEKVNESDNLVIKNHHELTSTLLLHDVISRHLADLKLPEDKLEEYIDTKLEDFLNTASSYRRLLIDSQQDVKTNFRANPSVKTTKWNYYQEVVKTIENYRSKLSAGEQSVFDAMFISAYQPNNDAALRSKAERNIIARGDMTEKVMRERFPNASEADINRARKYEEEEFAKLKKEMKYKGEYALTPFTESIVSRDMVWEYYKRFSKLSSYTDEDLASGKVSKQKLLMDLNLLPYGLAPGMMAKMPEHRNMDIYQDLVKEGRRIMSPLAKKITEGGRIDFQGRFKNPLERYEWNRRLDDVVQILRDHPEIKDNFFHIWPFITAMRTGMTIHRSAEFASAEDIDFFIGLLKRDPKTMEKLPLAVRQSWYMKTMPMIAEDARAYTKKFDLHSYPAHVTVMSSDGPVKLETTVKALLGPMDLIHLVASSFSTLKNTQDTFVKSFFEKVDELGAFNKVNEKYSGVASKLFSAAVGLLEEPNYNPEYQDALKRNPTTIYLAKAEEARSLIESLEGKTFRFKNNKGTEIEMTAKSLVEYFTGLVNKYQKEFGNLMNKMQDDHLISYTGQEYGKSGSILREVDLNRTLDNIVQYMLVNKTMPMLSKRALTDLAVAHILGSREIDMYSTPAGIFYGKESSRPKAGEEVADKLAKMGSVTSKKIKFSDMDEVQKEAFIRQMYSHGSLFGFELGEIEQGYGRAYFPHSGWSAKTVKDYFTRKLTEAKVLSAGDSEKYSQDVLTMAYSAQTRGAAGDDGAKTFMARMEAGSDVFSTMHYNASPLRGRSMDPITGWDASPVALLQAHGKLIKETADMLFAVMGNQMLGEFQKRQVFGNGEEARHVIEFLRRYMKQSLGFMDKTPSELGDGYQYGLETNFFKYHSDQYWIDRIKQVSDTWFGQKVMGDFKHIEEIAKSMKFEDEKQRKIWVENSKQTLAENKLSQLSQMEAKWSLISLLTSMKSYVTNVVSANAMTLINTSAQDWWKAYSLKAMQDELGSMNIKSIADAQRLIGILGGLEGQFTKEYSYHSMIGDSATREVLEALKRDGVNADVQGIMDKYGVGYKLMDKAAWFMRQSERVARQHSMLAHYFNARRALSMQGFNLEWNDPWVIQIARDGVNASQFLYSNANRPAFMGTTVGKIFHRFQLYAYNSIDFRRNVLKAAQRVGTRPGDPAYDRFQRMMVTDMFAMGLASMMPFTIFGSALQPPYNYLQQLVQFFFGRNEKEKQDAFYGGLPYPLNITQPVTPPSMRGFIGLLNYAYSGDPEKIEQTLYSMVPGQRIMHDGYKAFTDAKKKKNPSIIVDDMTGLPLFNSQYTIRDMENRSGMKLYLGMLRSGTYSDGTKKDEEDINQYLRLMPPSP